MFIFLNLYFWVCFSKFDLWTSVKGVGKSISVLLAPSGFAKYIELFRKNEIPFKIMNSDIQS